MTFQRLAASAVPHEQFAAARFGLAQQDPKNSMNFQGRNKLFGGVDERPQMQMIDSETKENALNQRVNTQVQRHPSAFRARISRQPQNVLRAR